jgi:hypothetical protein
MYKQLAPAAVHRRLQDLQRHCGAYFTPRPNFIWSIDGYLKLPRTVLKYIQQLMHILDILYGFMLASTLVRQLVCFGSSLIPLLLLNSNLASYDQTVGQRQSY